MRFVIESVLMNYTIHQFPSSVIDFLEDLRKYFIEHPYSEEFNESNVRSIEKVITLIQNDPNLVRTLWRGLEYPNWLKLWNEGKKVCIDLSEYDLNYQKILVPLLLQTINNFAPHTNSKDTKGIVIFEDTDYLFKNPPYEEYERNFRLNRDYYNEEEAKNYFLTKEQLEEIHGDKKYLRNVQLDRFFSEFLFHRMRCRNISIITTCGDPLQILEQDRYPYQISTNLEK